MTSAITIRAETTLHTSRHITISAIAAPMPTQPPQMIAAASTTSSLGGRGNSWVVTGGISLGRSTHSRFQDGNWEVNRDFTIEISGVLKCKKAREVISRHLKRLEGAGFVALGRGRISLTDAAGLRAIAD